MTLTPEAQRDLAWLVERLGQEKVSGPVPDEEGPHTDWRVSVVRADGRELWCYGESPEAALATARRWTEGPPRNRTSGDP